MRALAPLRPVLAALAAACVCASAAAQPAVEPWRTPTDQTASQPSASKARTPSGEAPSTLTPAERRAARELVAAVFGRAAAAQRAEDKAAPISQPDLADVQPKPQWTPEKGNVGLGGKGVRVTTPF